MSYSEERRCRVCQKAGLVDGFSLCITCSLDPTTRAVKALMSAVNELSDGEANKGLSPAQREDIRRIGLSTARFEAHFVEGRRAIVRQQHYCLLSHSHMEVGSRCQCGFVATPLAEG